MWSDSGLTVATTLHATQGVLGVRLNRGARRAVFALSVLMVATAATLVIPLKEIHALTHPAERPRVRGYEPNEAAQNALLDSLTADSES